MQPTAQETPLCDSTTLAEGGLAHLFRTPAGQAAFAVRWQGQAHAWINSCAHAGGPLDFQGEIFERSGRYLMCARHGAIYDPATGVCAGGPCRGARLSPVPLREHDGQVWLATAT